MPLRICSICGFMYHRFESTQSHKMKKVSICMV